MSDLQAVLGEVLDTAMALAEADFGTIHILDPEGNLRIVAHRGFPDWWVEHWSTVRDQHCTCGKALALGERVTVEDIEQSPIFTGTSGLDSMLKAGVCGMQSAPFRGASGEIVGIFSMHWRTPYRPDEKMLKLLDMLAAHASTLIERERSEENLHRIMRFSPIGIAIADWELNIKVCNPAYTSLLGYAEEELKNIRVLPELVFPEDREANLKEIRRLQAGEFLKFEIENRYRRKDGEIVWVRKHVSLLPGVAAGKPSQILVLVSDLTPYKQAEQALHESEERFRTLYMSLPIGVVQVAPTGGVIQSANPAFCTMLGYSEAELVGQTFAEITYPDDREADLQAMQRLARNEIQTYHPIKRYVHKNGNVLWADVQAVVIRDDEGKIKFNLASVKDLTEQKLAYEALEKTRAVLAEAQKIAHVGSFEYDVASGTTVWSEEEYRIYGLDPAGPSPTLEEAIAHSIPKEDSDLVSKTFVTAVEKQEIYELDHRLVRPDGSVRWIRNRAQPFFDEQGKLIRYVGTTLDITDLRQAEELARERLDIAARQQRLATANEVAALMAHELNQPLAAVAIYAGVGQQLLKKTEPDITKLKDTLDRINQQSLRAGEVVHHIRKFVERESVEPQSLDLNTVIHSTRELMEVSARLKKVRLVLKLAPDLPPVLGVEVHLQQVLLNLMRNALEAINGHGSAGGKITVETRLSGSAARVTVRDSGPGIPPDQAEQIFNRGISQKPDGLGLGLRISRSLIEADGGKFWVEPHVPGAIFHFEVPLA